MPKKTKTKTTTKTKVVNRNKNTNINTVHVHVEKPKTRKRRTTKPKTEPSNKPLTNSMNAISRGASQNLGFHPRGLINNEIQQPTIVQQLQAPPDPRIEKLDKRTKKLKEYLKASKENNNIQTTQPTQQFQDVFSSPSGIRNSNSRLIEEETIKPNSINFNTVEKPKKKSLLTLLFSSNKKKVPETNFSKRDKDGFEDAILSPPPLLTLEYKPEKSPAYPPATAPDFMQSPTGKRITQELKNLVNEINAKSPNRKMHQGTFRSKISAKLKELGVESNHTDQYLKEMNRFYKEIFDAAHEVQPA
jgi:hypothetical protein